MSRHVSLHSVTGPGLILNQVWANTRPFEIPKYATLLPNIKATHTYPGDNNHILKDVCLLNMTTPYPGYQVCNQKKKVPTITISYYSIIVIIFYRQSEKPFSRGIREEISKISITSKGPAVTRAPDGGRTHSWMGIPRIRSRNQFYMRPVKRPVFH